ncbi:uncharacterized protein L3040_002375 [Drepanopeziza brunnea f. sp. 'multigermtubi']|uniref:uncharacterized protein n=1 Tax=Drepanopeziza brunnea f. sp. 'multigermtubi' TaxID=698441 RepID=UPI002388D87E|nr:hypothetical protein L3040_002375 [Drepanopeziza brunnea f. sp. 'multigermtubi']
MPRLRLYYDTISKASLISLIRRFHIRVRLDCDPNFSAKKATESFTGMEELTIEVFQAQFGGSDYEVLTLFEDIRGVKRARVYGSVRAFPDPLKDSSARELIFRIVAVSCYLFSISFKVLVKSINNYIKIFIKLYMFRV